MSDEQRRVALETTGVGVWSIDLITDELQVDERAAHVFDVGGTGRKTVRDIIDRIHSDDRETAEEAVRVAASPHGSGDYAQTYRLMRGDGSERWVEINARMLFEEREGGRDPVRFVGTVRDVNDRHVAERELRESEERLRIALDAADLGMWVVDPSTGDLLVDRRGRELFGLEDYYASDGGPYIERIHPDDRARVVEASARTLDPDAPDDYDVVYRVHPSEGVERWVSAQGHTMFEERDGKRTPVQFSGVFSDVTEQRAIEQSLRESEEQVRVALDGAQLGAWALEPDTGRIVADERARAMFDVGPDEEVTLALFFERVHPGDREEVSQAIERALDPDEPDAYEVVYRALVAPDVERWVEARGQAVFVHEGGTRRAVRFTGILSDVTTKKATERALLESEERLRTIFERIDEGYSVIEMIVDADGEPASYRFVEVNSLFEKLSGLSDPIGKTIHELLPGVEQSWIDMYARVGFGRETVRFEMESPAMGRWYDVFATPIEPHGRFAVVFRDATAQRNTDRALRESEGRLRAIFERIDEGYALCEILVEDERAVDYRFIEVNPLFETMTGLKDAAGKRVLEMVPDLEPHWVETYGRVALQGESMRFEQGAEALGRWFDVFATPVEPHGRFAIIFRDTTERHKAELAVERREAELRALNESLEARVAERTAQLEQRNRDLQYFAHAASHDLQEPLRKISIFAGMIADDYADRLDEQGRYFIDRVQNAAQRLGTLVRDLLAYSRVSSRGADADEVDLNDVAQTVLEDLELAIRDSGAQIQIDALPTIHADSAQMHQLLQNLLENAIKYRRPDHAPTIRLWADADDQNVRLMVRDDGIGIDPKHHERIFAPFGRLHGRSEYAGSGIGLAVCRRIAERHGGSIAVEGALEEGSAFIVTLPRTAPLSDAG